MAHAEGFPTLHHNRRRTRRMRLLELEHGDLTQYLDRAYWQEERPVEEIARDLGVSRQAVYIWLQRFGLSQTQMARKGREGQRLRRQTA